MIKKTVRLIKKYPNRRLYDTKTSTYITLEDIRQCVISNERFQVIDAKTEENLTRSILLHIILEAESSGTSLLTEEALCNMIRFYGNAFQSTMGSFLEHHIRSFLEVQTKVQEQLQQQFNEQQQILRLNQPYNNTVPYPNYNPNYNPDLWAQLLNIQQPATQMMMGNYLEHSQQLLTQLQEVMKTQSRAMMTGFMNNMYLTNTNTNTNNNNK